MDRNAFGGGNPNSLYVPMSELEQEVVSRLIEARDLRVHVVGWGVVNQPRATVGDARLQLRFQLNFDRPEVPMRVSHFDLELRTGSGMLLFKDRKEVEYGGQPIQVAAGMFLDMVWDIAIRSMDPKLVKAILPSATGLTSRLLDKDTGEETLTGNLHLDSAKEKLLRILRSGEWAVREKKV